MSTKSVDVIIRTHDKASGKLNKIGKSMDSVASGLKLMVNAYVGGKVARGFVSIMKTTASAQEVVSKFDAVFKKNAKSAKAFASSYSKSIGRSKYDSMKFMATLQDTFVPLGFAREEAAEFSKEMLKLTYDLASFNDESPEETLRSLQSALVGNHETVRRYGVILNETILKEALRKKGLDNLTGSLLEQAKAEARMELIIAGTADAQGDAARTADSLANSWRSATAAWHDFKVELGKTVAPTASDLLRGTTSFFTKGESYKYTREHGLLNTIFRGTWGTALGIGMPKGSESESSIKVTPQHFMDWASVGIGLDHVGKDNPHYSGYKKFLEARRKALIPTPSTGLDSLNALSMPSPRDALTFASTIMNAMTGGMMNVSGLSKTVMFPDFSKLLDDSKADKAADILKSRGGVGAIESRFLSRAPGVDSAKSTASNTKLLATYAKKEATDRRELIDAVKAGNDNALEPANI